MNFLEMIKKNGMLVAAGAIAVLALGTLVFGIIRLGGLRELLSPVEQQAAAVRSILDGVNVPGSDNVSHNLIPTETVINELKQLEAVFKLQGYQTLQTALQQNIGYDPDKRTLKRQLLLEGIFPKPINQSLPFKFPENYRQKIDQLLVKIQSGTVPTQKEIEAEKELVRQQQGLEAKGLGSKTRTGRTAGAPGMLTGASDAELAAEALASIADKKAQAIKVYCDSVRQLDVIGELYAPTTGRPAPIEDMWWAQLSYWIQDDITNAIAEVNSAAKNVFDAPVKRILKIQVMHGYLMASETGRIDFVGANELQGPGSFTGLGSGKYYDLLRFQADLVVDVRKIPVFIDAMYRQSHYLLYLWTIDPIKAVASAGRSADGTTEQLYRYGDGVPVVKLTTYWEAYLLRDFYHWGIVGYGIDNATGKSMVRLHDGTTKVLDDLEQRTGLAGLMPKTIRQILGSEPETASDSAEPTDQPRRGRPGRAGNMGD